MKKGELMLERPMISILMPFKNEAKFLSKTLDSILNQDVEFELIAVDDHSTDSSWDIISKFDRVKVFKNEGNGTIDALRLAYSKCSGDFITRMDADDLMPEGKLKELRDLLIKAGKGHVSTGRVEYFSDGKLGEGFKKYANWLNDLCKQNNHFEHIFKECVIASPNWMMYRDDFERIGGFKDSIYPEDYHLVFKMWQENLKVISSKEVTHLWRDHENRASRNLEVYRDQKFYDLKLDFFLKEHGDSFSLWGAGPSGKSLVKKLIARDVKFSWHTNNDKKIGKIIYGVKLDPIEDVKDIVIIAVSQFGARENIIDFLAKKGINSHFEF